MSDLAQDASWELLQELCQYLPARYPTMFKFENGIMNIIPTGEKYDLKDKSNLNPIVTAAKLVQDDLAIMIEKEDGSYYLESGCICLAGFWRLKDKFGMKLDDIHKSGDVPQYDKQLKSGMNKFFRRLTVNSPWSVIIISFKLIIIWIGQFPLVQKMKKKSVGIPLMNLMMSINYILEVKDKV